MKQVLDQIKNQKDLEANWLKQQGQLDEALRIHHKYAQEDKSSPPIFIQGISYLAQVISFLLAAFLPISFIMDMHSKKGFVIILLVASILILGILELAKRFSLQSLLAKHYNTKQYSTPLIIFILLLGLASAFTSTLGGAKWGEFLADQSESIKMNYQEHRENIIKEHNQQLLKLDSELNEFISSVSYRGKINISNSAVKKKLLNIESKKETLEKEKVNRLRDLTLLEEEALSENSDSFQFWEIVAMCLSILFEITLWLSLFYTYNIEKEFAEKIAGKISYQMAQQNSPNGTHIIHDFQKGSPPPYSISASAPLPKKEEEKEERRIGFSAPPTTTEKNQKVCLTCGRSFKAKHPAQKFCSNKGDGNCKDRYNNDHRPHYVNPEQSEIRFSNNS